MLMWQNEDYRACLLAGMVPNEAVSVRSAAFDALRTLSCAKELKRFIWQSEFISAFLFTGAAEGQPVAVRVVAFEILYCLSNTDENLAPIWQCDDCRTLILAGAATGQPEDVRREAFDILSNLVDSDENKVNMWQNEACRAVLFAGLAQDQPMRIQEEALDVLRFMTHQTDNSVAMWNNMVCRAHFLAAAAPDRPTNFRSSAVSALCFLSYDNSAAMWEYPALRDCLLAAAMDDKSDGIDVLRSKAMSALHTLSLTSEITPLMRQNNTCITRLLAGAAKDQADVVGTYAVRALQNLFSLFNASEGGRLGVLEVLLEHGAEVNTCSGLPLPPGWGVGGLQAVRSSPLFLASHGGHVAVVERLLSHGATVDLGTYKVEHDSSQIHCTPLYAATAAGRLDTMKVLISARANINLPIHDGGRPLNAACENGHADALRLLLKAGADVPTTETEAGSTLLHVSARRGYTACVDALAAIYPEPVPWFFFLLGGAASELATSLLPPGERPPNCLPKIYDRVYLEQIRDFLHKPRYVELNKRDQQNRTALGVADATGHVAVASLLRDLGATL
jgi:hypothetical protein